MVLHIDKNELNTRIELNCRRLAEGDYYHIDQVFAPADYDWYGDKEGRALLAFVSHCKISGVKIPCMAQMLEQMGEHLNASDILGLFWKIRFTNSSCPDIPGCCVVCASITICLATSSVNRRFAVS